MRILDLLATLLVALVLAAAGPASAQAPSRAARLLTLLAGDSVGVLVASDRVFSPDRQLSPLSACVDARCAPVRSFGECAPPACPGSGVVFTLEEPIADVGELPHDRDGFDRAMDALRQDPQLGTIAWSFGAHPDPAPSPPRWIEGGRTDRIVWELGAYGIGGVLGATGIGFVGGEASGGFRFTWSAHGADDDILAIVFGNVLGADLRVRGLALLPTQAAESWGATIGLAPSMGFAEVNDVFRLPTLYSVLLPEVGVALREGMDAALYAGWSLPFTFLVDAHLGLEARATVLIVDDWIPGDDIEVVTSLGLGLVAR